MGTAVEQTGVKALQTQVQQIVNQVSTANRALFVQTSDKVRAHSIVTYNTLLTGVPGVGSVSADNSADAATTINLTTAQTLSLTASWSGASTSNKITSTVGILSVLALST